MALIAMGFLLYQRNVVSRPADTGDAPNTYGSSIHFNPDEGPYFGSLRGDDDRQVASFPGIGNSIACKDDSSGTDDEDAFAYNFTPLNTQPCTSIFLPEINAANKSYTISVIVNGAEKGDPVRAWIDFDGNGKFDENEKAGADYQGGNMVTLTWMLPFQLHSSLTYVRFRTCKTIARNNIEYPSGEVTSGEDEDYIVRISAPVQLLSGLRNQLSLDAATGNGDFQEVLKIMNRQKLGNVSMKYELRGTTPDVFGINNFHEPTIVGLRMGHETNKTPVEQPIISCIQFSESVENLSFQLLDIDAGDRVRIEGFYNGRPVKVAVNNLTDNYYYNYNVLYNEIYGQINIDAGNDSMWSSSLDMGVEVYFKGFIDSIRLSYSDEPTSSSGTYTLAALSSRMYSFDPYVVKNISIDKTNRAIGLSWKAEEDNNVAAYILERSTNGISFEVIARLTNENSVNNSCLYIDSTGGPLTQLLYYRVKTVSIDNSAAYSPVVRVRRNVTTIMVGFTLAQINFTDTIHVVLIKDMPGAINARLYDYEGKIIRNWAFSDKIKSDTLVFGDFSSLLPSSYYLELINDNKTYLKEVIKENH
jgi:hypothetical protein